MSDPYRQKILRLIEAKDGEVNLKRVSAALGKNHAYMQQFINRGTPRFLPEDVRSNLAKYLGVNEEELRPPSQEAEEAKTGIDDPSSNRVGLLKRPLPPLGERDLPVLGTVVGGNGDDADVFQFNGQVNEYVVRPAQLQGTQNGYAVYINGDSMEPVAYNGQIAYVNPNRPPKAGRLCVVELYDGRGFIKEFVKRTPTKLLVKQYNPKETLEFVLGQVKSCHYVPLHGDPD